MDSGARPCAACAPSAWPWLRLCCSPGAAPFVRGSAHVYPVVGRERRLGVVRDGLAYDNARLPQALIVTGSSISAPAYIAAGLRSLRWLMAQQTSPAGLFRPVGSDTFGERRRAPRAFDQQPLEASATISACLAAWRGRGRPPWKTACRAGQSDLEVLSEEEATATVAYSLSAGRWQRSGGGRDHPPQCSALIKSSHVLIAVND